MFMHFSCIRTLSFLSILCWVVMLCFLFLSLSLSLIDCAWHPSINSLYLNPFRFGTSSSDPTPLYIRFRDEKAYKDFSKNFSKRGVHSGGHVILSDFSNIALPTAIHSWGWESLCEIPVSCPTMII